MNKIKNKEKIREVFINHLPKRGKFIDWENSIGYKVKGNYEGLAFEVEITKYDKTSKNLYIKYLNGEPFEIYVSNFKKCKLGKLLDKITKNFKIEVGVVFKDDKRNITIIDRKYIKDKNQKEWKMYKYKCNKCGFECGEHYIKGEYKEEHWIDEYSLLNGVGCSCCGFNSKSIVLGINTIWDTDRWMCDLGISEEDAKKYSNQSNQKIIVTCPDCKNTKEMNIANIFMYKSICCNCGDGQSYPNKLGFALLEQLNINFETEYSPDWIKPKRYDFYFELNDKKYIVEMDGGLGHGKKVHGKSKLTIEKSKAIDNYKEKIAKEYGVEVIRINADVSDLEHIKNNILNSKLDELFHLSQIDWLKCEEFALSNRVKEACNYKILNENLTCNEIGKIMNINQTTVLNYLNKGKLLNWCKYDAEKEMKKVAKKMQELNKKQVEVFKDKKSLGIFNSLKELEEQSENLFGVKLWSGYVTKVCKNIKNQYHGYTFVFV